MENENVGIENIKEAVYLVAKLGEGYSNSMSDGELSIMDAFNFIKSISAAYPAISNIGQVKSELANMSDAEKKELYDYVEESIEFEGDTVELIVENSIKAVIALGEITAQFFKKD